MLLTVLFFTNFIFKVTFAVSLLDESSVCEDFEVIGPYVARTEGEIIENKIIIAEPTDDSQENDFALKIV